MAQPYTLKVDNNTARELATKGASLVLLDVPEATVIGIDQQVIFRLLIQLCSSTPPPPLTTPSSSFCRLSGLDLNLRA
jgi:hypothetical protein